jgi:pSer/pThr/pTyr-binding forkhead associated (FHA) protein
MGFIFSKDKTKFSWHLEGSSSGKLRVPIDKSPFIIGRSWFCNLSLDDGQVSRKHCRLDVNEERVYARDLGTINGTYHNGTPLSGTVEIFEGDQLYIGTELFKLIRGSMLDRSNANTALSKKECGSLSFEECNGLTTRESEVLVLLAAGRSTKEIAETFDVKSDSVQKYIKRIFSKTGCANRVELLARYRDHSKGK